MKLLRLSPVLLAFALIGSTQLSCSVNDYCLNCDKGDGGHGSNDGGTDGNGSADANVDAGCVPTGGPEQCNGKDDDCNGLVDDNAEHEGEPCDNLNGACAGGVKVCTNGAMKCTKNPSPEICDGIDNNCSGPLAGNPSGADEGDPGPPPAMGAPETGTQCGNGTDDDGDGIKDDGCPGTGGKCGTDQGECTAGQYHCDPTTGTVKCFGFIDHTGDPELCDGKDNNCNGQFDEGITFSPSTCGPSTNTGACEFGTKACQAGTVVCVGAVFPAFDVCNNVDDDCDGVVDQNTNKNTDTNNCGYCGDVCATRANANTTCTVQAHAAVGPAETGTNCGNGADDDGDGIADDGCSQGTCGYTCKAGYKDLNGMPGDGCEFGPCFPTGVDAAHPNGTEVCDGADNDCDGLTDSADPDLASQVPTGLCLGKGECGNLHGMPTASGYETASTPPTPVCDSTAKSWVCNYPGTTQFPETRCDGLDNNCDGNIDEYQAILGQPIGQSCHEDRENPATQCGADTTDNDGDGKVNDGCDAVGAPETGAQCANATDDDGDGAVNDGCPAVAQLGVCQGTGAYQCDTRSEATRNGAAFCSITTAGSAPTAEACDNVDNDCDGIVDNGGSSGNLASGQEWITLGNGHQMMRYEASRPDSSTTSAGSVSSLVCSKSGSLPWTNVKYEDALAACQSIGAQLCSETQWHHACSVANVAAAPANYPIAFSGTGTYIEAEDYSSIGVGAAGAETTCNDNVDSDGDGVVNDGCPIVGTGPETMCNDKVDSDGDGTVNDGCPAYGPAAETTCNEAPATGATDNDKDGVINDGCPASGAAETNCRDGIDDDGDGLVNDGCPAVGPTWVPDYTTGFSGVSAMEALPNLGVSLTAAQAVTAGARLDYAINFTGGTYHVWVKLYSTATATGIGSNHTVFVGVKDGTGAAIVPPQLATATVSTDVNGTWKWFDAGTFTVTTGVRYVSVYMGEDGVKLDRIYLVNGTTSPATGESLATAGNVWAYASSASTYQPNTCNGHDYRQVANTALSRVGTGVVTVTTSAPHPFVVGDLVQILGSANASFDGTYTVTGVLSTTQFTYLQNSTTSTNTTGGTSTEAKDPQLPTGSLTSCYANVGTGIFDMSGNAREWTLAHSTGENPIRGGASNGTAAGISCGLNFTLADDTFFFPNIGFRCCR